MLSNQIKRQIKDGLPDQYRIDKGEGFFPDRPGASMLVLAPVLRWRFEDVEPPDPPYVLVTMSTGPNGVENGPQPMGPIERDVSVPDSVDADIAHRHGNNLYDLLNLQVTASGHREILGRTLTPRTRAGDVTEKLHEYLLQEFSDRPLDPFDEDGNVIDDSGRIYGSDLNPEIEVERDPNRTPDEVSEQVGASETQWDAAVELHYQKTWLEYYLTADTAEITSRVDVSASDAE